MIAAAIERTRFGPPLLGLGTLVLSLVVLEGLVRAGAINGFIVPRCPTSSPRSRASSSRRMSPHASSTRRRRRIACALVAVFGISAGAALPGSRLAVRRGELGCRRGGRARPPLMYPLFLVMFGRGALTIIIMAFVAGLAPVTLKTLEGLSSTRRVFINVGRSFNLTPGSSSGRCCSRPHCRPSSSACGSG